MIVQQDALGLSVSKSLISACSFHVPQSQQTNEVGGQLVTAAAQHCNDVAIGQS